MATLRDKIWLWGQIPGGHHNPDFYKLSLIPKENKMTPSEGLEFFGIDKLCRVKLGREPNYDFLQDPWLGEPAKQICLSLIGAGGAVPKDDMDAILTLAKDDSRIVSAVMDDFYGPERMEAFTPEVLRGYRERLHNALDRPLELWSVIYERDLDKPMKSRAVEFDLTTFWTWFGERLPQRDEHIKELREKFIGDGRLMLGVYLYDYGNKCPLSDDMMRLQLDYVGEKLASGEIEGAILCSNCVADIGLSSVPITLEWLDQLNKIESK